MSGSPYLFPIGLKKQSLRSCLVVSSVRRSIVSCASNRLRVRIELLMPHRNRTRLRAFYEKGTHSGGIMSTRDRRD